MKKLREGFTTGSCAAAAALACCLWLRDGECPPRVEIVLPEGRKYAPEIIPQPDGGCGVIKDSGDDPDMTKGMMVISRVIPDDGPGEIRFRAGAGVGTITEAGLKLPPGEAAINPVPRKMIADAVRSVFGARGAEVTVSIPGGLEIARKTFNPRLGIIGGLSILGTSGVVRPMSEEALKDALYAEIKMRVAQGKRNLIFTFGNQGESAMAALYPAACIVQVSNEIGFMLDAALELGVERILLGGHPGKLSKIAAGVMQTHSRTADARREAICTQLALMGAPVEMIERIINCKTTDGAMEEIQKYGYGAVWTRIARAARDYCRLRVRNEIRIAVAVVDGRGKLLGECAEEDV